MVAQSKYVEYKPFLERKGNNSWSTSPKRVTPPIQPFLQAPLWISRGQPAAKVTGVEVTGAEVTGVEVTGAEVTGVEVTAGGAKKLINVSEDTQVTFQKHQNIYQKHDFLSLLGIS